MVFRFGDHVLDTERWGLRRGAEPGALEPQVIDLLVYLVRNRGRVVSKDDLIHSVWGGRIVSDSALTTRLNAARKAVNDSGAAQCAIRTVQIVSRQRATGPATAQRLSIVVLPFARTDEAILWLETAQCGSGVTARSVEAFLRLCPRPRN